MPRVVLTEAALGDLVRLRDFLVEKSPEAAERAKGQLVQSLNALSQFPESNKPVPNMPHQRELVIKFGARGYVARYRYERGEDVVVLRLRHQREE